MFDLVPITSIYQLRGTYYNYMCMIPNCSHLKNIESCTKHTVSWYLDTFCELSSSKLIQITPISHVTNEIQYSVILGSTWFWCTLGVVSPSALCSKFCEPLSWSWPKLCFHVIRPPPKFGFSRPKMLRVSLALRKLFWDWLDFTDWHSKPKIFYFSRHHKMKMRGIRPRK